MGAPSRLLIIGLDGADYDMLSEWLVQGRLPHLARLAGRGRLLPCASTYPPLTAPAWTTVVTGCNPGKHGVYDFMDMSCPERLPWWTQPRRRPSIWRRLSSEGMSCGVLNVPLSYPAEPIDGVMVSGMGGPALDERCFHPGWLHEEFLRAFPKYEFFPKMGPGMWPDRATLIHYAQMHTAAAEYLWQRFDFDVFMLVISSMDWAGHGYAHESDKPGSVMLAVAQAVDECVGKLVAQTDWPRTTVMLVSDHGMRGVRRQINLPALFIQLGLMSVQGGGRRRPGLATRAMTAWNTAKRVLPPRAIAWLRRACDRQREAVLQSAPAAVIDWRHTIADPVGAFGSVRINLQGRHPGGSVPVADYEGVRRDVMDRLAGACDPATGRHLFSQVLARDVVYRGPTIEQAPDILLVPAEHDMALGGPAVMEQLPLFLASRQIVGPLSPACGTHSSTGILMASGDAVACEFTPAAGTLEDFAPTVLRLLDLPVPPSMDGRPLFTDPLAWLEDTALQGDGTASLIADGMDEEEEELLARLRGLGYV